MNKKLIAVAVGAALGAPALALAQASTVQLYGRVNIEYGYVDEGGTRNEYDAVRRSGGSRLGFRGEEKLGGGLSAWFQCESTLDVSGGGETLCRRNSAVGFKHASLGNIFIGNWDTAYKLASGEFRPFSNNGFMGVTATLHNEGATGNNTSNTSSFRRRQNNSVNYHTPTWNGFTGMVSWSAQNEVTGSPPGTAPLTGASLGREPRVWSLAATYRTGPLYIGAGYERHDEFRTVTGAPAGTFGDDDGWTVNAAYTFNLASWGRFKLGAIFERLTYETGAAGNPGAETERDAWGIFGDWKIRGPHNLRVGFIKADDSEGGGGAVTSIGSSTPGATVTTQTGVVVPAGDNGAKQYLIEYAYAFSKRTEVGLGYNFIDNDRAGLYRNRGATRATGQDQDAIVLTVRHRF